ncbi:hypothetical protein HA466_0140330 [Hirschfeldia incana]|nr:hypothetical protein HA466_0140330 [Hirschfeldia incana]
MPLVWLLPVFNSVYKLRAAPLSSVSSPRGFRFWFQQSLPQPAPEWFAWPSVVAAERICGVLLSLHKSGSWPSVVAEKRLFGFPLSKPILHSLLLVTILGNWKRL